MFFKLLVWFQSRTIVPIVSKEIGACAPPSNPLSIWKKQFTYVDGIEGSTFELGRLGYADPFLPQCISLGYSLVSSNSKWMCSSYGC